MPLAVLVERTLLLPEVLRTGVASWVDPAASLRVASAPALAASAPALAASLRVASAPALAA